MKTASNYKKIRGTKKNRKLEKFHGGAKINFVDGKYKGDVQPGTQIKHGTGKMKYNEDNVKCYLEYTGNWVNNQIQGRGKMEYDEGNYRNAAIGYIEYDGDWSYYPDLQSSHPNGQGKMIYMTGETYEGSWEKGQAHGQGKWSYEELEDETMTILDEDRRKGYLEYEGNFHRGRKHGVGVMTFMDGRVYEGNWNNNEINGQGTMKYEGMEDVEADNEAGYLEYEGEWLNGEKRIGEMTFLDGRAYEGNWNNDKINGEGIMYYDDYTDNVDGYSQYQGEFENGQRHGHGLMHFLDGRIYDGNWEEDRVLRIWDEEELHGYWHGITWMDIDDWDVPFNDYDEDAFIIAPRHEAVAHGNVALEIHRAAAKINLVEYLELIDMFETHNDYSDIIEYAKSIFIPYIIENFGEESEQMIQKLNGILTKITQTLSESVSKRNLIGKTVDFVFEQPKEFTDFYIKTFIQDCYHAYVGEHGMSCVNGIVERFYMIVGDSVFAVCPDGDCDNPVYKELLKLFNKHIDKNALTQEWANLFLESEELKQMNKDQRKDHYINFMRQKYMAAGMLDEHTEGIINEEATKLDEASVFDKLEFGGKKKKRKYVKKTKSKRRKNKHTRKNK